MSQVPGYLINIAILGSLGSILAGWDGFVWGSVIGAAAAYLYYALGEMDGF